MATSRTRRRVARVLAGLLAVFGATLWFGLIDMAVVVQQNEVFHFHYVMESGWGLFHAVLVAVPLVVLTVRPGDPFALAQLQICAAAVLVAAVWASYGPAAVEGVALALVAVLLAWLGGVEWTQPGQAYVVLVVLTFVALPYAVWYGHRWLRPGPEDDITNGISHYPMQAALALAVVGVCGLAAVTGSHLATWTCAFTAAWLGVESWIYPDLDGSLGRVAGALAVVWALLVVLAREVPWPARPPVTADGVG